MTAEGDGENLGEERDQRIVDLALQAVYKGTPCSSCAPPTPRTTRPQTRGNSKIHNIQKCECCQASHFSAEGCPSWKHRGAGRKESAHSKYSTWNDDQTTREQRSVQHGHVDLPR